MRAGWEGNARLQDFVRRVDSGAGLVAEVVTVDGSDIIGTKDEWDALTVASGAIELLDRGGVRIQASESTLASHTTDDGTDSENLTTAHPFDAIIVTHLGSGAGLGRPESREFHTLTARLDPRADGGSPKTVDHFIAEAFRVTRLVGADEMHVELIARSSPVDATGEVALDFDFAFQTPSGRYPVAGPQPETRDGATESSRPQTLFRIIAYQADGSLADNVSWLSDSTQGATKTGSGYQAGHYTIIAATRQAKAQEGGTVWENGGTVANMPYFTLTRAAYAKAVVGAVADAEVADIPGSGDLTIVARGEEWDDSALTWEIYDGTSTWYECTDGDVIGQDNEETIDGVTYGNDLSSIPTTGPWDVRVTLDPSTNNLRSPVAIDFGIERVSSRTLAGAARVSTEGWSIPDPANLKANIPSSIIEILKTGERDFRDYGSALLSANHIGDVEVRVYVGDPSGEYLHRSEWMLHSVWEIEDYESRNDSHALECLSPLRRLRVAIPPFVATSGNDGTREPVTVGGTIVAAWEEIVDSLVALPARFRGQGPEDTTACSKRIDDDEGTGDAKDELDRVAYLAGLSNIESQGKLKAVPVMRDEAGDYPVAAFPVGSYTPRRIGPGFRERIDEFFVRYAWDESSERFESEARYLNGTALDNLGGVGINATQRLDAETCKWITSSGLAALVGKRIPKHFGTGKILWSIDANERSPHLELGDFVLIETDLFVARSPVNGVAIRGRVAAQAIVVGIGDAWGKRLTLWVPGYEYIAPSTGSVTRSRFGLLSALASRWDLDFKVNGASYDVHGSYDLGADVNEVDVSISWIEPGPSVENHDYIESLSGTGYFDFHEQGSAAQLSIPNTATSITVTLRARNSSETSRWGKTWHRQWDDFSNLESST